MSTYVASTEREIMAIEYALLVATSSLHREKSSNSGKQVLNTNPKSPKKPMAIMYEGKISKLSTRICANGPIGFLAAVMHSRTTGNTVAVGIYKSEQRSS